MLCWSQAVSGVDEAGVEELSFVASTWSEVGDNSSGLELLLLLLVVLCLKDLVSITSAGCHDGRDQAHHDFRAFHGKRISIVVPSAWWL